MSLFDKINTEPKLLVSDSLQGSLSEEELGQVDDIFITAVIVVDPKEFSLMGNLVGIEFGSNPKIDMRVSLKDAFNFVGNILVNEYNKRSRSIILAHSGEVINIPGPYRIANAKIIEVDPVNKLCILAIDLIKDVT